MLLPWLVLLPFIGGLLCWQSERLNQQTPRRLALLVMVLTLMLSLLFWFPGNDSLSNKQELSQWQTIFIVPWITSFG
ncbi:MAG: NADH-quinone oxidoreductase subunit M, partial [Arsenophonus sp.]|nr:NADH-quinone oxidoreductase subunit M [Arsenophonus sp.]